MRRTREGGNIILAALFMLVISFLGIGLLSFSLFHSQVRGARRYRMAETGRMQQALVYYLHYMREEILNRDLDEFAEPETGYFNSEHFPQTTGHLAGDMIIKNTFSHRVVQKEGYRKIRIAVSTGATSRENPFHLRAETVIRLVHGRVPVTEIPKLQVVTGANQGNEEPPPGGGPVEEPPVNMSRSGVNFHSDEFLLDALNIQGTAVTWAAMRKRFGFEVNNEPVPEGIHLLVENDNLGCIFVQGNVDRLIFSTKKDLQVFRIVFKGIDYDFHYLPGEAFFISYDNLHERPWLFAEKIVVNGDIISLSQAGDAAFKDTASMTLYASGNVTIRGDLLSENFTLGKIPGTGFTLACTFAKLFGKDSRNVTVEGAGKEKTVAQISVITDGTLENKSSRLEIEGSIAAGKIKGGGTMTVGHSPSKSTAGTYFRTVDFKGVTHFLPHALEEVFQ